MIERRAAGDVAAVLGPQTAPDLVGFVLAHVPQPNPRAPRCGAHRYQHDPKAGLLRGTARAPPVARRRRSHLSASHPHRNLRLSPRAADWPHDMIDDRRLLFPNASTRNMVHGSSDSRYRDPEPPCLLLKRADRPTPVWSHLQETWCA